jgi:phospholipase C
MQTRRQFVQNVALISGAAGLMEGIPAIQRAMAIEPEEGSSFLDAEHVVILMQENRSFDHLYGTLAGVRGFNDPRAIRLANGNPVWVQSNAKGESYVPFRLDINETKTTWMGSLPHGWPDQVDATNGGKHDRWLDVKKSGHKEYASMPLTLGYHTREDLPFYYALADAFTVCDQYFCSSLTGTTPNRLHLWTGTIREKPTTDAPALVRNEDCEYGQWTHWPTFPERLEDLGVSWRIYQNDLDVPTDFTGEEAPWLSNYGDSPIEWFTQYGVRFAANHRAFLEKRVKAIPGEIEATKKSLEAKPNADQATKLRKKLTDLTETLARYEKDLKDFSAENFEKLSARAKSIHQRAFTINNSDPAYRQLEVINYQDGDKKRTLKVPKGDVLHQFRKDVESGTLPTVSWIVAPERFSDHPSSAWYGQWYLSEILDILTKNPKVWKKTVFILNYDENDGYFDHVPPFLSPHPKKPETGKVTPGIDTAVEFVELAQDKKHKPNRAVRESSIGLGYRVPMIIASPWTRGGCVCSQVFDHTSVIQFLEKLVSHKTGKKVEETNITRWRRTVCGDLTSAFQAKYEAQSGLHAKTPRNEFLESIHRAQFKKVPTGFHALSDKEIGEARTQPSPLLPKQEAGTRRSSPLPYQLEVNGSLDKERKQFTIHFSNKKDQFKDRTAGSPFIVYAFNAKVKSGITVHNFTVAPGEQLEDSWNLDQFENGHYHFRVHGPNGFFREFTSNGKEPVLDLRLDYERVGTSLSGKVVLHVHNRAVDRQILLISDRSYGADSIKYELTPDESTSIQLDTTRGQRWYDYAVQLVDVSYFEQRFAGRVETGAWGISDPAMGTIPL